MAASQWRARAAGRALQDPICGGTLLGQGRGQLSSALWLCFSFCCSEVTIPVPGAAGTGLTECRRGLLGELGSVLWGHSVWKLLVPSLTGLRRACASAHPCLLQLGRVLVWLKGQRGVGRSLCSGEWNCSSRTGKVQKK